MLQGMAQTRREIEQTLASVGSSPRHRFGQNFMIDGNLVRLIAEAGEITTGDIVIEVGPGTGTLTDELLARALRVIAVEIDRDLASALRTRFAVEPRLRLIEGDALDGKHALNATLLEIVRARSGPMKLVANLPYNIASPLIVELLIEGVELLAFTVQKEVADRIRADAGSDDFGGLSVVCQTLAQVEVLRTIPPEVFWPRPKIDSSLVRLRRRGSIAVEPRGFGLFVQKLFSFRRKTLRRGLIESGFDPAMIDTLSVDLGARPETLDPTQMQQLWRALS
jgi:16S rRNA (adenine1518-N6/adenine1519-N6)-dimethyltransferase